MSPIAHQAIRNAEDAIAFFARAAILRHAAGIALELGQASEHQRLMVLASEAERIVAVVVSRITAQLRAPKASQ